MQTVILKPETKSNNTGLTGEQYQAFLAWYKQLNVGVLTNKDGSFSVKVGDHVKIVKLDKA